eukprot:7386462-Prymnesium_polylepis.2
MVLMCQRLLPEGKRNIYLQGAASFTLPAEHEAVTVYCKRQDLLAEGLLHTRERHIRAIVGLALDAL